MAYFTKALEFHKVRPVITGGQAVEFYTTGGYSTGDIDLICSNRDLPGDYLETAGFQKKGRYWHHSELDLFVEIPGSSLTQGEEEHLNCVELEECRIYFIGQEDMILDRLNAYVHWKSDEDGRWAKELLALYQKDLDWNYLQKRALEEKTSQALEKLKNEIKTS